MALTKKMLKAMSLEDAQIEQIFDAHEESINALREMRDSLQADLDKANAEVKRLGTVEKDLVKAQAKLEDADNVSEKLRNLQNEFAEYKADVDAKTVRTSKENAYKKLLKEAGVSEKRIDSIIKISDISGIELDEDGNAKNKKALVDSIKGEWADFIVTAHEHGAQTPNPPANNGGAKMSKDDIFKIKDTAARQQAMLENKELFLND